MLLYLARRKQRGLTRRRAMRFKYYYATERRFLLYVSDLNLSLVRELAGYRTHHRASPRLPMHELFGLHFRAAQSLPCKQLRSRGRRGATCR